jgi:hypothetical protein
LHPFSEKAGTITAIHAEHAMLAGDVKQQDINHEFYHE